MELLDWLKENYQWRNVKFVNEALIETEHGRKRLRYWSDKALLDWHITWRDECSVTPYMLADRMIRNKDQEAAITWKDGWLTVHDEVKQAVHGKSYEEKIGKMIGSMIAYGLNKEITIKPVERQEPQFRTLYSHIPFLKEEDKSYVRALLQESDLRMNKVKEMKKQVKDENLPIIDPAMSIDQAKTVYDLMIWYGSNQYPEEGYYSLRNFLGNWLEEHGKESATKLIRAIVDHENVSHDQALLLLIECLKAYELDHLVAVLKENRPNLEMEETLQNVTNEWERSRELVEVISVMIENKKKVFTS